MASMQPVSMNIAVAVLIILSAQFARSSMMLENFLNRRSVAPTQFDSEIAAFCPPQLRQPTPERCDQRPRGPIALRIAHQDAYQPRLARLLRMRSHRPRDRRAAEKCDELAPLHKLVPEPQQPITGNVSFCASQRNGAVDVRFGSKADIPATSAPR